MRLNDHGPKIGILRGGVAVVGRWAGVRHGAARHRAGTGAQEGGHLPQRRRLLRARRAGRLGSRRVQGPQGRSRRLPGDPRGARARWQFGAIGVVSSRGGQRSAPSTAGWGRPQRQAGRQARPAARGHGPRRERARSAGRLHRPDASLASVVPAGHRQGRGQPADLGHRAESLWRGLDQRLALAGGGGAAGVRRLAGHPHHSPATRRQRRR